MLGDFLDDFEPLAEGVDHFAHEHFGGRRAGGKAEYARLAKPVPVDVDGALD